MPTGHYERKPRVERVPVICATCGNERLFLPGFLKAHPDTKFCGRQCGFAAKRKPERLVAVTCGTCKKVFSKRVDRLKERNYCSTTCAQAGKRLQDAKWRNPAYIKEYMQAYQQKNRERHLADIRRLNRLNPEAARARRKRWRVKNKPQIAARQRARRTRIQGGGGSHSASEWQTLKMFYGSKCLACDVPETERPLTADHVVPVALGGSSNIDNIQPLCQPCNTRKGTKTTDYRINILET